MSSFNPEFTKNLKLEFNPIRLLVAILLLGLVVWIGSNAPAKAPNLINPYTPVQLGAQSLFSWLCGFGFLFAIVWGSYLTSSSLVEEIKTRSWDFVRMSSLSPMKILLGKIFGAPAIVWVVSVFGILPELLYAGAQMMPGSGLPEPPGIILLTLALCLFSWMIFSYALQLLLGLSAIDRRGRSTAFSGAALVFLIGSGIGGAITTLFRGFCLVGHPAGYRIASTPAPGPTPPVSDWYGMQIYSFNLFLALIAFFSLWTFIGAWRALRKSLQYRDAPWAWTIFIVTASLFMNGIRFDNGFANAGFAATLLHWPMSIGIATMIFTCAGEAGNIVRYRSFGRSIATGAYREAFRLAPLWTISFAAFLVGAILDILTNGTGPACVFLLSLIGFVARDLLAYHAIAWTPAIRRPIVGLAVYGLVMYILLPMLAGTFDRGNARLFFPDSGLNEPRFYWFLLLAEVAMAGLIVVRRGRIAFTSGMTSQARV